MAAVGSGEGIEAEGTDNSILVSSAAKLRTHSSSLIAKVLEYRLLADAGAELLRRGLTLEISRSDVDADGYDVVVEANGIVRHIQLKTKVLGGNTREISCHTRLADKPSGCIIWTTYDPETFQPVSYGCYGNGPGLPLPDPGEAVARRSTHNKRGERPARHRHRIIKRGLFDTITEIPSLVDWLFGKLREPSPAQELRPTIIPGPSGIPQCVQLGLLAAIPITINLSDRLALAVVVDRELSNETNSRRQAGFKGPLCNGERMVTLNLELRSWSFGPGTQPDPRFDALLSTLIEALRPRLDSLPSAI